MTRRVAFLCGFRELWAVEASIQLCERTQTRPVVTGDE